MTAHVIAPGGEQLRLALRGDVREERPPYRPDGVRERGAGVDEGVVDVEEDGLDPAGHRAQPLSLLRAAWIRSSVRSRPSTSSDSKSGRPTVRPVTATRTGA